MSETTPPAEAYETGASETTFTKGERVRITLPGHEGMGRVVALNGDGYLVKETGMWTYEYDVYTYSAGHLAKI